MERPLHLCEILEQEHYALNGNDWRVTPADIIDANDLAKRTVALFGPERFTTIRKPAPGAPPVDLNSEKKGIAEDLNSLVLDPRDLTEFLTARTSEAQPMIDGDPESNRRTLDQLLAGALRAG